MVRLVPRVVYWPEFNILCRLSRNLWTLSENVGTPFISPTSVTFSASNILLCKFVGPIWPDGKGFYFPVVSALISLMARFF